MYTPKQHGFVNASVIVLLVAGAMLGGLLIYGAASGQEMPLWPALLVTLVNLVAAGKLVLDVRKRKRQQTTASPSATPKD